MPIDVSEAEPVARLAAAAADRLERLRRREPRIHCLTNTVAQTLTANVLLAVGASPAMSMALDEIDGLVAGSAALVINLGTLDDTRRAAMTRAAGMAAERGVLHHGAVWPHAMGACRVGRARRRAGAVGRAL